MIRTGILIRIKSIMTIEFPRDEVLGLEATVGLLQAISNAAGAYVELTTEGVVCSS